MASADQQPSRDAATASPAAASTTSSPATTAPTPTQPSTLASRPSKRPLALAGIATSAEERNVDFLCPVCFDLIREPTLTRCGHSFCYVCIFKSIGSFQRCPKCSTSLTSAAHIFPNRLLGELISKHEQRLTAQEHLNAAQPPDVMDVFGNGNASGASAAAGATNAANAASFGRTTSGGSFGLNGGGGGGIANISRGRNALRTFIASESEKLGLPDVQAMLDILQQRKITLEAESTVAQNTLLHEFLCHLLRQKQEQATHIRQEIELVQSDLQQVLGILGVEEQPQQQQQQPASRFEYDVKPNGGSAATASTAAETNGATTDGDESVPCTPPPPVALTPEVVDVLDRMDSSSSSPPPPLPSPPPQSVAPAATTADGIIGASESAGFNSYFTEPPSITYLSRKRRLYAHFDDFVQSYFSVRSADLHLSDTQRPRTSTTATTATTTAPNQQPPVRHGLDVFRENLVKFSRYNSLRPLATMYYSNDLQTSSTIVSSIDFDKDNEYFAIGGVTKRIKVFDYMAVVRDTVDIHYPSIEMTSPSKISCIAWNSYHKNVLATSDYEGVLYVWDVNTGQRTNSLHEHEKRCWSVDFNEVDTRLIATGSDDSRVKLWSTNDDRSIATLEAKANVCCVKFNPKSSVHLAFGSADHDVHYYDLRNMAQPLCVFKGHKKAVSYVKFLNASEIVSASTDSQLKLWNVNGGSTQCLRSFTGHVNEKNFVGLATDGDYVACGSEDNALYVYYKGLSKQLFSYRIDAGVVPKGGAPDGGALGASVGVAGGGGLGGTIGGASGGLAGGSRSQQGGDWMTGSGMAGVGGMGRGLGGVGSGGIVEPLPVRPNESSEFLSAVCWRKGCNVVLAANSRGLIKVFELI